MASSLIEAAIGLRRPVFPCDDNKRPLHKGGFKTASQDAETIMRAFSHRRASLIGVPTGIVSGLVVIDVDVRDGKPGLAWYEQHADALLTRSHRTMSGGLHLLFRAPQDLSIRNSASKLAPAIDVRGDGGYIIHPPSPGYSVQFDGQVEPLPHFVLQALLSPAAREPARYRHQPNDRSFGRKMLLRSLAKVQEAGEGRRNSTLNAHAFLLGTLVGARLLELADVSDELFFAARQAGLTDKEIKATLNSGLRAGMARPRESRDG